MGLHITKYYLTNNACYIKAQKRTPIGIQLHSIGASQGSAKDIADSMANSTNMGVTYICDADIEGNVLQTLPEEFYTYADGGFGNRNLITIEMGESDFMKYKQNSAEYYVTNSAIFRKDIIRSYNTAVLLCADICKRYKWDPQKKLDNGLYLISSHYEGNLAGVSTNHVDPFHIWDGLGLTMDKFRADVKAKMGNMTEMTEHIYTSKDFTKEMSEAECAEKALEMAYPEGKKNHIFPSIIASQGILESGYFRGDNCLHPELVTEGNNAFGMKCSLSGNTWKSVWDGESKMTIETPEEYVPGVTSIITADFRTYPNFNKSLEDHTLYLLGAMDGDKKRYAGLQNAKNYKDAITIIKNGGYATDSNYITKICDIIQRYKLDRYDSEISGIVGDAPYYYRVGTAWINGECQNQYNAYLVLDNAKKGCPPGYAVFDEDGKVLYINKTSKEQDIINKAVAFAQKVAHDDTNGYFNGGYKPEQGYCCISLVVFAYINAGLPIPYCNVWDADSVFMSNGFKDVTAEIDLGKGKGLKAGDIVWRDRHVAIMTSDSTLVEANGDYDGKPGDSSSVEIFEHEYYHGGWKKVFRYPTPDKVMYRVQTGAFTKEKNANARNQLVLDRTGLGSFYEKWSDGLYHTFCGSFEVEANAIERMELIYEAVKHMFKPIIKVV